MRHLTFGLLTFLVTYASALADVTLSGTQLLRSFEIESNALRERPTGRAGLTSYRFLTEVGGVNFELVADLPSAIVDGLTRIEYDSTQPDGARVRIHTESDIFTVPLYDWILIPTIHYANSPYSAVVSLLGGETSVTSFHARYHPALEDTLVGLRLLQADLMPRDLAMATEMPQIDGTTILGKGESENSWAEASDAAAAIELFLLFSDPLPDSWILTDVGAQNSVPVVIQNRQLIAEPAIYYSFWYCEDEAHCKATDTVTVLDDLNAEMREAPWRTVNPPVWAAAEQLAGYSAVFRALAAAAPAIWSSFYSSVPKSVAPVQTPNLIPRG